VSHLLPRYYSGQPDDGTGAILQKLAGILAARHHDTWLRDVLRTPHSPAAYAAFLALKRADEAEHADDSTAIEAEAREALRLFADAASPAGVLRSVFERQSALIMQAQFDQCEAAAPAAERALRARSYTWLLPQTLLEDASCATRTGNFEREDSLGREALRVADRAGYPVMLERALGFRAGLHQEIGNLAEVWRESARGLVLYWNGSYPPIRAQLFYSVLTFVAGQDHTYFSSAALAKETAETAAAAHYVAYQAYALRQLAMSEFSAGLVNPAEKHLRQSFALFSSLPAGVQRSTQSYRAEIEVAEMEGRLGKPQSARERLLRIRPQAEAGDALTRFEFNTVLGGLLLRQRQYAESRSLLEAALRMAEHSLALASPDDRPSWLHALGDVYRALVECEIRSGSSPRASWNTWLRYRTALLDEAFSVGGDAGAIPSGKAVLSIAELPTGIAAWFATSRGFSFHWLQQRPQSVYETVARLVRACASPRSPPALLRADARQLSNWLLGAWEHELDGVGTLVIESDGPVSSAPWPALIRSSGRYWSDDFAIRIGAGRPGRTPLGLAGIERALVIGDPALEGVEDLPPLPEAENEAQKVSRLFPRSTLLKGSEATWTGLHDALASAELFHFAGHGYGGDGGGLLLRGDQGGQRLFAAADVRQMSLTACRLVVLSGCSTGTGEREGPGSPQSLVRAFLRAGAGEVVASSWNLGSAGAQIFMSDFYSALLAGKPVAEALRIAGVSARSVRGYVHPYYWAGLEVFSRE